MDYPSSSLLEAVKANDFDGVCRALKAGADPNYADGEGCTPLFLAVKSRRAEIVQALLKRGADPDQAVVLQVRRDYSNTTNALSVAVNAGDRIITQILLKRRAELDRALLPKECAPLLRAAARDGSLAMLDLLVSYGADVNAVDADGRTPLMDANNNWNLLTGLLVLGAVPRPQERCLVAPLLEFPSSARRPEFAEMAGRVATTTGSPGKPSQTPYVLKFEIRPHAPPADDPWNHKKKSRILDSLYWEALQAGALLLDSSHSVSSEISLYPTTDKYAVMAIKGICDAWGDQGPTELIQGLQPIDASDPFLLRECCRNSMEIEFISAVDPAAVEARLRQTFHCSGPWDLDRLKNEGRLNFWWGD